MMEKFKHEQPVKNWEYQEAKDKIDKNLKTRDFFRSFINQALWLLIANSHYYLNEPLASKQQENDHQNLKLKNQLNSILEISFKHAVNKIGLPEGIKSLNDVFKPNENKLETYSEYIDYLREIGKDLYSHNLDGGIATDYLKEKQVEEVIKTKEFVKNFIHKSIWSIDTPPFFSYQFADGEREFSNKRLNQFIGISNVPDNVTQSIFDFFDSTKNKINNVDDYIEHLIGLKDEFSDVNNAEGGELLKQKRIEKDRKEKEMFFEVIDEVINRLTEIQNNEFDQDILKDVLEESAFSVWDRKNNVNDSNSIDFALAFVRNEFKNKFFDLDKNKIKSFKEYVEHLQEIKDKYQK